MTTALRATIGACQGCGACLLTCPERAVRPDPGPGRRLIVLDHCTGCAECLEVCPVDAISLVPAGAMPVDAMPVDAIPVGAIRLVPAGPPSRHREEEPS